MTPSDLSADCVSLDGSETVSVTLRRPDGRIVVSVAGALRRALSRSARAFDGLSLVGDEIVWHLPQLGLGADEELHPGDTITVGGEVWSLLAVSRESLNTRWRCTCRRQP